MPSPCIIPGCNQPGIWVLGVRARLVSGAVSARHPSKKATDAAWAPNLPAYLCDDHAYGGALLTLLVEPRKYKATRVRVLGAMDAQPHRTVRIR
jgi:hypothetical protein